MRSLYSILLVVATLVSACGHTQGACETPDDECDTDADCPAEQPGPCAVWACIDGDHGARECQHRQRNIGAACNNGNLACVGTCEGLADAPQCVVTQPAPLVCAPLPSP